MEVRKTFHQQLDELYIELLKMANTAFDVIEQTRDAFSTLDATKAGNIIEGDDVLDEFLVRIEETAIELLARQAPVAIDLRSIIVIMWSAQHLERLGDNCVNINKAICNLQGYTISPWIHENMDEMFQRSEQMLVTSVESLKERDTSKAEVVPKMDDTVDRLNRTFLTSYKGESEEELELIIRVVMIARFIERIADHAVDIAENVHYMVTGEFAWNPPEEPTT